MNQSGLKWIAMDKNGPKGSKWTKMDRIDRSGPNGLNWTAIDHNTTLMWLNMSVCVATINAMFHLLDII